MRRYLSVFGLVVVLGGCRSSNADKEEVEMYVINPRLQYEFDKEKRDEITINHLHTNCVPIITDITPVDPLTEGMSCLLRITLAANRNCAQVVDLENPHFLLKGSAFRTVGTPLAYSVFVSDDYEKKNERMWANGTTAVQAQGPSQTPIAYLATTKSKPVALIPDGPKLSLSLYLSTTGYKGQSVYAGLVGLQICSTGREYCVAPAITLHVPLPSTFRVVQ